MSTGYFKSVRYELIEKTRWVKVRYILEENKPINDIQIKGATIFKHDSLKKSLKSKVSLPYNLNHINADRKYLEPIIMTWVLI